MKNKLLLCFIACIALTLATNAKNYYHSPDTVQKESDLKYKDTTKFSIGKMKVSIVDDGKDIVISRSKDNNFENYMYSNSENSGGYKKHFEPHWAGFGLSMNNYLNSNQEMNVPKAYEFLDLNTNKSMQFDFNVWQLGINIFKQYVGLVSGVGFRWNNYHFSNSNVVLTKDSGKISYYTDSSYNFIKSRLRTTYLTVPALIEFQIPIKNNCIYASAGVEGAVKLTAKMKNKSENGDKIKTRNDFYINPFTYNLTARVGYKNFGLYGTYSMIPLFKKGCGPELYPFALGATLNF